MLILKQLKGKTFKGRCTQYVKICETSIFSLFISLELWPFWKWRLRHGKIGGRSYSKLSVSLLVILLGHICSNYVFGREIGQFWG